MTDAVRKNLGDSHCEQGKRGGLTADHIARELNFHHRTVNRHLIDAELSRQNEIVPLEEDPPQWYEHRKQGDMVHFDIMKLLSFNAHAIRKEKNGNHR